MTKAYYNYIKEYATDYIYIFDITRGKGRCTFFCGELKFLAYMNNENDKKQVDELLDYIDKRKSNDKQKDTPSN